MGYIHYSHYLQELDRLCEGRRTILICDSNVFELYSSELEGRECITLEASEANKNLQTVEALYRELVEMEVDRGTLIVALGGGITTDIVGYVASTLLRGVACGYIPTTLLGQIDASIGGKCGVNLDGYKNLIGTFTLPEFVIIDSRLLSTLPPRELRSAYGEVLKYAVLRGAELIESSDFVRRCVEIKLEVTEGDFKESGQRKLLNLGHTLGHAVEKCTDSYTHGEAVAIGIAIVARISNRLGFLDSYIMGDIIALIKRYGLPTTLPPEIGTEELLGAIKHDKKRKSDGVEMVLIHRFGECFVRHLTLMELADALNAEVTHRD